jgi:hypothetical protein
LGQEKSIFKFKNRKTMKKLFVLTSIAMVAMCLAFTSCKKDEDPSPSEALVGTWEYDAPNGSSSYDATLVLKADKTGEWERGGSSSDYDITLWVASPEELTIEYKDGSYTSTSTYDYYISDGYLVIGSTMYKKK